MHDALATLHADYAALEANPPAYLDSDQQRSLTFYLTERGIAPVQQAPFTVAQWLINLHDLEVFIEEENRSPRENNRLKYQEISAREHLADWVRSQRRALADGRRCQYQRRRLACVRGFEPMPVRDRWDERRNHYQSFLTRAGRVPRVRSADHEERSLALWATKQRLAFRRGTPAR